MRVILYGPVTADHLATAALLEGIEPTCYISNGQHPLPRLPEGGWSEVVAVDPKLGLLGRDARDYTLAQGAEALIAVGEADHMIDIARMYGLAICAL